MQSDAEVLKRWSGSAPFWEKHRENIRQMFAPIAHALVEDGQIGLGNTVLDIATGPGEPALSVAGVVGREGKIIGIDPVLEMIEGARRATAYHGLTNVQFEVAAADQLPFPADTFDAVISRFGVMFFRSPVDAVREMLRVLKPGKKLALAVWHFAERNPFHYSLSQVMNQYVHTEPPGPDAPDAFRFASPGKLREILKQAGTVAPTERLLQFPIQSSLSVEDFLALRLEMSDKLRAKVRALSERQTAEATRQALESLRKYSTDQGMSFPAEVLIVSGAKGGPR